MEDAMACLTGFFAYPANPADIGSTVEEAIQLLKDRFAFDGVSSWKQSDVCGRFIADPIFARIRAADYVAADITKLNFNVTYEIGYAIGCRRRILLVRHSALVHDTELLKQVGIFDTLGYQSYSTATELASFLRGVQSTAPLSFSSDHVNRKAPVFVVNPRDKTDLELRITSRIKKAMLQYRSFDPQEQPRLSAGNAIQQVAQSFGVVCPLLSQNRTECDAHNLRAAFVAGLAAGMEKTICLLQFGDDPVPLDYRDLVKVCSKLDHINEHIAEFAPLITEQFQYDVTVSNGSDTSWLASLSLGQSAAENEFQDLSRYYIEIDEYQRAKRGEVQVVTGRKGSGKTALFGRLRDHLRADKRRIILDLKPEGYQLLEFMEVLRGLAQASREHVVSAFWEYLLLLEIANKLIQKDRTVHVFNHKVADHYRRLETEYLHGEYSADGDFAERMMTLTNRIAADYRVAFDGVDDPGILAQARLTELIYKHDIGNLRACLIAYLQEKEDVWILFDNLDKGWPANGVRADDLVVVRGLLDALNKVGKALQRESIPCRGLVFIRNDVYELLLDSMPDRGKIARANLDWTDPNLLRELLRRRLVANASVSGDPGFEQIWARLCESHIDGEETSQYLIERSLMRPRGLLDLVNHCRSHGANLRHDKITVADIRHGEEAYSTELVQTIDYEIRDVFPAADGIMFDLLGEGAWIEQARIAQILERRGLVGPDAERALDFLLWYGVLGIVRDDGDPVYIYNMHYSAQRMRSALEKQQKPTFQINPAFWAGLEVK